MIARFSRSFRDAHRHAPHIVYMPHMKTWSIASWSAPASSSSVPVNRGGTGGSCRYSVTEAGCVVRTSLAGSYAAE